MRNRILYLALSLLIPFSAAIAAPPTSKPQTPEEWETGEIISSSIVRKYGVARCFTQQPISNNLFKRIYGKSFGHNCAISRSSLRYLRLLHYNSDGNIMVGEMICNKDIADDLLSIFRKLFDARYPIERIQLIDDYDADDIKSMNHNNTSCFNFRAISGSKKLSNHSLGRAIDINPLYNPYVKRRPNGKVIVNPESGSQYADRSKKFKYKIDHNDLAYRLFTQYGFRWGGNWRTLKDYQHFEK